MHRERHRPPQSTMLSALSRHTRHALATAPSLPELSDAIGEKLRSVGGEFGATTGRPRRCGWFDSVMVRKAVQLNGLTRFALTKIDVLNGLDDVRHLHPLRN